MANKIIFGINLRKLKKFLKTPKGQFILINVLLIGYILLAILTSLR